MSQEGALGKGGGALGLVCGFPFVSVLCRSLSASARTLGMAKFIKKISEPISPQEHSTLACMH